MNSDPISEPFGAVPHRLLRSLALGEISHNGFTILCYLTLAEDHRRGEWIGTTERMVDEIGWEFTPRHLSREIKRLADDGWIESGVKPRSRSPYSLRLTGARVRRDCDPTATPLRHETPSSGRSHSDHVAVSETGYPLSESDSAAPDCEQVAVPRTAAEQERPKDLDLDQDLGSREKPAAAVEPASESEIREAVASLRGADRGSPNVIEPLARLVPSETFFGLVERARAAHNPAGWLKSRLEGVIREGRLDERHALASVQQVPAPEPIERLSPEEALEANIRQFVANGHAWEAIEETIAEEQLDAARAIYDRAKAAA